jgi:hypothetical protein
MKKHPLFPRKHIYASIGVIVIVSIELFIFRDKLSMMYFIQWNDLGVPPSEAEYVVEYGYIKCKDGNIYKHYSIIDPKKGWINEWLVVHTIDEYYAYDSDISACAVPEIINIKSIIIRCRKLENYSKTYAMAIGTDGRVYDYINSSTQEIKTMAIFAAIIIVFILNIGVLFLIMGGVAEKLIEGKQLGE